MIGLIDTHQHLIYPEVAGYSWTNAVPALAGKAFTLEDYQSLTEGLGVDSALFMEAGADDSRHRGRGHVISRHWQRSHPTAFAGSLRPAVLKSAKDSKPGSTKRKHSALSDSAAYCMSSRMTCPQAIRFAPMSVESATRA